MDVIHFSAAPLSPRLSLNLSLHLYQERPPLLLIIKYVNRARCFTACVTPGMINCTYLVTIHHVSGRQEEEETLMKSPITTCLQPKAATSPRSPISPGSRCSLSDLGDPLLPPLPWKHRCGLSSSWLKQTRVVDV